jgi:hypothetical protein
MLNLPSQPGVAGALMLGLGAVAGLLFLLLGRRLVGAQLAAVGDRAIRWTVTGALAITLAGAPYTLWRVVEDIRRTAPIAPEHARYVGAETKLADGELVERIGTSIPERETYYVAVAPDAYFELQASLALWMGYALIPRRQVRDPAEADWVVTWGATPGQLRLVADRPRLVGRNRLFEQEPVYLARASVYLPPASG